MVLSPFEDEDIDEHDDLDACSIFHNGDDSCLLDVVDELHNANGEVGKDVCVTDGDVGLTDLDVHIGCLICVHIPDDLCLNDSVVGLHDELVEIVADQCDVIDEVELDV